MSSERYELTQDELEALLERVESTMELITDKKKRVNSEEHRYWMTRTRSELNDARGFIQEMEKEARAAPAQYRNEMLTKVRQYREETAKLQNKLKKIGELAVSDNQHTDQDTSNGDNSLRMTAGERLKQRVMKGTESLDRTSQSIERSTQLAVENEEIGDAIISDLGQQRETLERSRARLQETNAELSRGRRILIRLKVSTLYNKILLLFIIIIELCILAALIYWKFFS